MADPLFTPRAAMARRFSTADGALSFLVPAGWVGDGQIQIEPPDDSYVVFDVTGPDDALIFSGHPDLPLCYVVPAPWHGELVPGRRNKFGEGASAQWLFPAPLATALQMARHLATRRFGDIVISQADPLPDMVESAELPVVDACRARFASVDGRHLGVIRLVVLGGGNPGDTWRIEHISGFRCIPEARETVAALYDDVMASIATGSQAPISVMPLPSSAP